MLHSESRAGVVLFALGVVLFPGCDSQQAQDEFEDRAYHETDGNYTQTDENGAVMRGGNGELLEDPNDWRIAPAFPDPAVDIRPAYPNPSSTQINLEVTVRFSDVVGPLAVFYRRSDGQLGRITRGIETGGVPSVYPITFSSNLLGSEGLHRIVIVSTGNRVLSYGDVRVE